MIWGTATSNERTHAHTRRILHIHKHVKEWNFPQMKTVRTSKILLKIKTNKFTTRHGQRLRVLTADVTERQVLHHCWNDTYVYMCVCACVSHFYRRLWSWCGAVEGLLPACQKVPGSMPVKHFLLLLFHCRILFVDLDLTKIHIIAPKNIWTSWTSIHWLSHHSKIILIKLLILVSNIGFDFFF